MSKELFTLKNQANQMFLLYGGLVLKKVKFNSKKELSEEFNGRYKID